MHNVTQEVDQTHSIGVIPEVVREVIALANDPRANVARLSAALAKDGALMSAVLQRANSPAYGLPRRIKNVKFAVSLLGFDTLKETVVRVLMSGTIRKLRTAFQKFEQFWNHSVGCAITARYLAKTYEQCDPDDAFVTGLLHDLGEMFTYQQGAPSVRKAIRPNGVSEASLRQSKHDELSAWTAERWGLSEDIVEAIRYQHAPWKATLNPKLTATLHMAKALSERWKGDATDESMRVVCDPSALEILNLKAEVLSGSAFETYAAQFKIEVAQSPSFQSIVEYIRVGLVHALDELSTGQKTILALYYYEGLSMEEIATLLELQVSEIKDVRDLALKNLKSFLTATHEQEQHEYDDTRSN